MGQFTQGDFSAFDLQDSFGLVTDMWGDNTHMYDQYKKPLNCFSDIFTGQTISINDRFLNASDCTVVKLAFICDNCDNDTIDCDDPAALHGCEIPKGEELGADELSYAPDGCFQSKVYTVKEVECKNRISFQQKMAYSMMKQLWAMDCKLLELFYGQLGTCASDLTLDSGKDVSQQYGLGSVAGNILQLAAEAWDPKIIAKWECLVEDCHWIRPMFITGSIWREFFKLVRGKSGNGCCDYDNMLTNSTIPIKHDIYKFDESFPGPKTGFLFDASQLAYYNIYCNENTSPLESKTQKGKYKYRIPSPRHRWTVTDSNGNTTTRPVYYDVYGEWCCINKKTDGYSWYLEHNGGFLKAPEGLCGTCPTVIQMEQPCVDC